MFVGAEIRRLNAKSGRVACAALRLSTARERRRRPSKSSRLEAGNQARILQNQSVTPVQKTSEQGGMETIEKRRVDTERRSTTEKDPTRERALLRERTGVLDGKEKKIQRDKKR